LTKKAPYKGLGADSEEKHEPATDIDTVAVDSLKALDPNGPIREADIAPLLFLFLRWDAYLHRLDGHGVGWHRRRARTPSKSAI
jgi:hypothetical protein